jgi:hypothetical protein
MYIAAAVPAIVLLSQRLVSRQPRVVAAPKQESHS